MTIPSDDKHYYGCKIARGLRSVTVWCFDKKTGRLHATLTRTPPKGFTAEEKLAEIADFLKHFKLRAALKAAQPQK